MRTPQDEGTLEEIRRRLLERCFQERESGGTPPLTAFQAEFPELADLGSEVYESGICHEAADLDHEEGPGSLGPYRLVRELGRGGNGIVHLAEDTRGGGVVALKMLRGLGVWSASMRARLRREAAATGRLHHPGICKILEVGEIDGIPFLAMEYIEGQCLGRILKDARGSRPEKADLEALELAANVARTLHAAHEAGLIHRDVNPSNIMVRAEGDPVLLDFGVARLEDDASQRLTQTGDLVGTPAYLAPELIAQPAAAAGIAADVYGLGVTLYECLTRQRPFEAATRDQLYQQILHRRPPDPRRRNQEIPLAVRAILEVALDKDPRRRYSSALAFAEDLERARRGRPILAKPPGPLRRCITWARRRPAAAVLLLVLATALPLLGGLLNERMTNAERLAALAKEERRREVETLTCEGYLSLQRGEETQGQRALRLAIERAESPPIEAVAGLVHFAATEPEELLLTLDRWVAIPEAAILRARLLRQLGRVQEAVGLEDAQSPPKSALAFFLLGTAAMRRGYDGDPGAHREALDHLKRAIFFSDRPRLLHYQELAHAAAHCGDREACIDCADALTTRWPDSHTAWFRAGYALERIDPDRAISAYEKALHIRPRAIAATIDLGRLLHRLGRFDAAARAYESALRVDHESADALLGLGLALREGGYVQKSITLLERSAHLGPELREALLTTLSRRGDHLRARQLGEEWSRAHPGDAGAHQALGLALFHSGAVAEARRAFEEAVRLAPHNASAHNNLGIALAESGCREKAVKAFETAILHLPSFGEAHANLGKTLLLEDRLEESMDALLEAVRLEPHNSTSRAILGEVLYRSGRPIAALAAWRAAVTGSPQGLAEHLRTRMRACKVRILRQARQDAEEAAEVEESDAIDAPEAIRLRERVLHALEAVFPDAGSRGGRDEAPDEVRSRGMHALLASRSFARLRSNAFLSRLDPGEAARWRRLWSTLEMPPE